MSLSHSPKIVTDGLIFYYDMNNTVKSWKGAPTTNVVVNHGQTTCPWGGDGSPTLAVVDDNVTFRGRKVTRYHVGTTLNCYLNGTGDLSNATSSTDWAVTMYMKRVDGVAISGIGSYLYISGNTNVNITPDSIEEVEDGWYKVIRTRTGLVSGYPSLMGFYSMSNTTDYYFANWQVEPLSYTTPFVEGTRSNTEAILDLTGNNTVTATSLTYNSDNTFEFNGTSDMALTSSLGDIPLFTVEAWAYPTGSGSGTEACIVADSYPGTTSKINFVIKANGSLRGGLYQSGWYYSNTHVQSNNVWQHVVYTFDGNNQTLYKNGVANTPTTTYSGSPQCSTAGIRIGRRWDSADYYNGKIGIVKIYNRVLSVDEIKQNFNAHRVRYGI